MPQRHTKHRPEPIHEHSWKHSEGTLVVFSAKIIVSTEFIVYVHARWWYQCCGRCPSRQSLHNQLSLYVNFCRKLEQQLC